MNRIRVMICFLACLIVLFFQGCGKNKDDNKIVQGKIVEEKFLFGTYVNITVYDNDEKRAHEAIGAAFDEIERIDKKFNSKTKGSIINSLNDAVWDKTSHTKKISIDDEGYMILDQVKKAYLLSNGAFDPTLGPLMRVWGFDIDVEPRKTLPTTQEIQAALTHVDFSKVTFDNKTLSLEEPIENIDTGSFLKGYAMSRGKKIMLEHGIKSAFISSISSIEAINKKPNNTPWRIGIQDPRDLSRMIGVVELDDEAMGVSGDYQTYVEIDGKRYHHILNKKTGYPVSDKKMVVVVCNDAFLADLYSTSFFLMPVEKIIEYVNKTEKLEVLIMKNDGVVVKSENIRFSGE